MPMLPNLNPAVSLSKVLTPNLKIIGLLSFTKFDNFLFLNIGNGSSHYQDNRYSVLI